VLPKTKKKKRKKEKKKEKERRKKVLPGPQDWGDILHPRVTHC
jgi:hypothetical protein